MQHFSNFVFLHCSGQVITCHAWVRLSDKPSCRTNSRNFKI